MTHKNYPGIRRKLWGGALWSPSYFAGSCAGAPISVIRQYIEQQRTPHESTLRRTPAGLRTFLPRAEKLTLTLNINIPIDLFAAPDKLHSELHPHFMHLKDLPG
jgi:hypothetical protein